MVTEAIVIVVAADTDIINWPQPKVWFNKYMFGGGGGEEAFCGPIVSLWCAGVLLCGPGVSRWSRGVTVVQGCHSVVQGCHSVVQGCHSVVQVYILSIITR